MWHLVRYLGPQSVHSQDRVECVSQQLREGEEGVMSHEATRPAKRTEKSMFISKSLLWVEF